MTNQELLQEFKFEVVLQESYTPSTGGRPYHSERVVARYRTESEAKATTSQYNREALVNQYYSIRKVEN